MDFVRLNLLVRALAIAFAFIGTVVLAIMLLALVGVAIDVRASYIEAIERCLRHAETYDEVRRCR